MNISSSQLVKRGKCQKISSGRMQSREFFLTDKIILYCKPLSVKLSTATLQWQIRGIIRLQDFTVDPIEDGTCVHCIPLKNAFQIEKKVRTHNNNASDDHQIRKVYFIMCESAKERDEWISQTQKFQRAIA